MSNQYSLLSLSNDVLKKIHQDELNDALEMVCRAVFQVISEPVCTAQVFGSKTLDGLCQKIGQRNFQEKQLDRFEKKHQDSLQPIFIYLVTKLQKSGGHTRVIQDFIQARPTAKHIIFSTELDGKSDQEYLDSVLPESISLEIEFAPSGSFIDKLDWLQSNLVKIESSKVYLFNHHQDSVIIAAVQPEMRLNLSFYHHGDHHLCLGVFLPNCEHIDIHAMGVNNCKKMGIENNIYIPLTVKDKGIEENKRFQSNGYLVTCTAARSNKIEKPYFIQYTEIIPSLLSKTKGKHIHIGQLSQWARLKIKRELKQRGVALDRFIYIPWVADIWKTLQTLQVDLYIPSFPYGGGLTLVEAMGAGIPIVTHHHTYSCILSGIDLAYPEVFVWHYPEQLYDYCASLSNDTLEKLSELGRVHYNSYYRQEHLKKILDGELVIDAPVLHSEFQPYYDEYAYWTSGQFTYRHILFKHLYKFAKKIKILLRV